MGRECIGAVGAAEQAEVVRLALESLTSLEAVSYTHLPDEAKFTAARTAGATANRRSIPVVLDPVCLLYTSRCV